MPLLTIIVALIIAGVVLYLINNYLPLDPKIKTLLNWVTIIVIVIWLLNVFGVWDYLKTIHT